MHVKGLLELGFKTYQGPLERHMFSVKVSLNTDKSYQGSGTCGPLKVNSFRESSIMNYQVLA